MARGLLYTAAVRFGLNTSFLGGLLHGAKPEASPVRPEEPVVVLQPKPKLPAARAEAQGTKQAALLEQLGLSRAQALDNLRRALSAPETRVTDPAIEAKVGAVVRGLLQAPSPNESGPVIGGVNPPGPVIGGVNPPAGAIAFADLTAAELSVALPLTEARIVGLSAELEGPAKQSLLERGGRLLTELEFAALRAQLTLPADAKASDLLTRMARAREVLELGKGVAIYALANPPLSGNYDPFTNEPGLDATLQKLTIKGGAAVGVSGSIFDVASRTKADLIVSVDANPDIADTIAVYTAILLAVDDQAKAHGWSDKQRAEEVFARLDAGQDPARSAALVRELEATPLPASVKLRLPAMLRQWHQRLAGKDALSEAIAPAGGFTPPITGPDSVRALWCRGPDSVERVAHLSKLAREGRIFTITGDLADPRLPARVTSLVETLGARVSSLNFSNIIDYVPSIDVLARAWRTLPFRKDAVLICSANHQNEALRDNPELAAKIGSFKAPAASSAQAWLGPGGVAERWSPLAWKTFGFQTSIWSPAFEAVSGMPFYFVREDGGPQNPKELEALITTWIGRSFGTPEAAQRRMQYFFEHQDWWPLYEALLGAEALAERSLPVVAGPGALAAAAERFDRTLWSDPADKVRVVRQLITERGVEPDTIPGLDSWAQRCPGAADLALLVRTVAPEKPR